MSESQKVPGEGRTGGKLELPDSIFAVEPNLEVVYYAVRAYAANRRRGTASTKTRGDVAGSGQKPWRQKGTGRARAGTRRSPLWPGGGIVFGPHPRSYACSMPKKAKRLALRSALTLKAREDKVRLVEELNFEFPKTRKMAEALTDLGLAGRKTLLLVGAYDRTLFLAGRNIPTLSVLKSAEVNAYRVMAADYVVLTRSGLAALEEVFGES